MDDADRDQLQALVERARRHDPDAWEALYRASYSRLFAYARRRVTTDHDADDAVSETMKRALEKVDRFTWKGAGFDAWLFAILRNVLLESYRVRNRIAVTADVEPPDAAPDVVMEVLAHEEQEALRRAFGRLAIDDQELLELRVVAGLSAEAVGEVLGKRPGAVRMAQSRALRRLGLALAEVSGGA